MTGAVLAAWRSLLGLSQVALGEELGVTGNTVARWERGEMGITAPRAIRRALQSIERELAEQGRIAPPATMDRFTTEDSLRSYKTPMHCPQCGVAVTHSLQSTYAGEPYRYALWACDVCRETRYTRWPTPEEYAEMREQGSLTPPLPAIRTRARRSRPTDLRRAQRRASLQGQPGGGPPPHS